jgi:hypothetical protein
MKNKITNTKKNLATILIIAAMFTYGNLFSQSQGVDSPAFVIEQNAACLACPGADWSTPQNAEHSDNIFTVVQLRSYNNCFQGACFYTKALMPSHYNFSIPNIATIRGIKVEVQKKCSNANAVVDTIVELMKGNTVNTLYNANLPGYWTIADSMYYYGDSTNLWGTTWTPSDINDTLFGLYFVAENMNPNNVAAFIDYVGITVYYSIPSGEIMVSSSDNSMSITMDGNQALNIITNLKETAPNSKLQLYNLLGQNMFTKELNNLPKGYSKQEITIGSMPDGIYFVELVAGDNKFLKKIIISR